MKKNTVRRLSYMALSAAILAETAVYAGGNGFFMPAATISAADSLEKVSVAGTTEKTGTTDKTATTKNTGKKTTAKTAKKNTKTTAAETVTLPDKINNLSTEVKPYQLYSLKGKSSELSISGKATTNYNLIKDKTTDKYTMMVYLCGTNLEDDHAMLSSSVAHMLQAAPKNMNVVILVGGTDTYQNTYLNKSVGNEKVGVYYLDSSSLSDLTDKDWKEIYANDDYDRVINSKTLVNISTVKPTDMGDPKLLSGFINLSTDLFQAKDYGLIMWNHGGGVIDGVCHGDSKIVKDSHAMGVDEMESALRSSNYIKNGGKLGLLAYDACLMGSSEIAYNLHNYYNYMYGCEEIEDGDYDYTRMMKQMDKNLAKGVNAKTDYNVAKAIHDSFSYWDKDGRSHISYGEYQQTGSVYESASTVEFTKSLNTMAKNLNTAISESPDEGAEVLSTIAIARMKCGTIAMSKKDYWNYQDLQYVDIGEFASFLKEDLTVLEKKAEQEGKSEAYINALKKTLKSIDELENKGNLAMTSTWYDGTEIRSCSYTFPLTMKEMNDYEPMSELWQKTHGTKSSYGTSVYFPVLCNTSESNYDKYAKFYEGTALNDYNNLVQNMITWKNSDAYNEQLKELRRELKVDYMMDSVSIKDYSSLGSNSGKYLEVKFNDQYGEDSAVKHTFGNAMYDSMVAIETSPICYAGCEEELKDENGETIDTINKVMFESYVSGEHFDLADSNLNVPFSSVIGYRLVQDGQAGYDFKLLLQGSEEATKAAHDQKLSIAKDLFDYQLQETDVSNFRILRGDCSTSGDEEYKDVYHVFYHSKAESGNDYKYVGTTKKDDQEESYKKVLATREVSFYDYYLTRKDRNGTALKCTGDTYTGSQTPAYYRYTVNETLNPLFLRKENLADYSALTNQYAASVVVREDGRAITEYTRILTQETEIADTEKTQTETAKDETAKNETAEGTEVKTVAAETTVDEAEYAEAEETAVDAAEYTEAEETAVDAAEYAEAEETAVDEAEYTEAEETAVDEAEYAEAEETAVDAAEYTETEETTDNAETMAAEEAVVIEETTVDAAEYVEA